MDILEAIDVAISGCQQCGGPLGVSPSDDFCDDECQQEWHAGRSVELVGYREPWDRPEDFPGVIPDEAFEVIPGRLYLGGVRPEVHAPANWSIPLPRTRMWGDGITYGGPPRPPAPTVTSTIGVLRIDWAGLEFRLPRETGDLRGDWARARFARNTAETPAQHAAVQLRLESLAARQQVADRELRDGLIAAFVPVGEAIREIGKVVAGAMEGLFEVFRVAREAGLVEGTPTDARGRALAARRNRNTGPEQRGRAPRSIGRPSTGARR